MIRFDDCLLILGRRGCGKSHLAKGLQKLWPRRVVIDTMAEYSNEPGVEKVFDFDQFAKRLTELAQKREKKFVLVFQFSPEADAQEDLFNEILRLCFYFGNVQIVIEEIQFWSTPHQLPKWLKNCLLIGRHHGLSLLFTSQRPGQVNKTILSQCGHIFCGQIFEGNDLNYLANFLNQKSDLLINLPDRQFLYFSKAGLTQISNDLGL